MPSSMTTLANFTAQYQQLIDYLVENTNAHLVIANIPDVTAVPYLTPAALVLGEASLETGVPVATLSQVLGIVPGDLVNPTGTAEVPLILTGQQAGPISDSGVLSIAEQATVRAQVTAFNQVIAQSAQGAGATLVDINALFAQTTANGITENGIHGTTAFLGGVFSLDGIHPTNTGYAVIANKFIDSINAALGKSYAEVDVAAIAATDPLYPPYPGHHFIPRQDVPRIPEAAAKSLMEIFGSRK
jgi:phospholipase/lecithinase/hemolysin